MLVIVHLSYSLYIGCICFFCQAEDGIRDLVRSRGLGDVYKRQVYNNHLYAGQAVDVIWEIIKKKQKNEIYNVGGEDLSLIHI